MYIHQHQRFANNNWLPTASILLPAAMKHQTAINTSCKRLAGHYTEALWMAGTYWCIRMRMKTGRRYYRLLRIDRHDRWSHQRSSIHYRRLRSRCITIAWCSSCWHRHCHTRTCCCCCESIQDDQSLSTTIWDSRNGQCSTHYHTTVTDWDLMALSAQIG